MGGSLSQSLVDSGFSFSLVTLKVIEHSAAMLAEGGGWTDGKLAAIIGAFVAGRAPIPVYGRGQFNLFGLETAGPKTVAALAKWVTTVDGAADNLKELALDGNEGLDEAEQATIKSACPGGVELSF